MRLLLGRRLPITTGSLRVDGLDGRVTIRRDRWGIPYIDARTDADAWFGLGFCHGQDRAFQLELLLRILRGTLAELFGPAALPVDRFSRRLGLHHGASLQVEVLDSDISATIEAYARGVTAGHCIGLPRQPHEFVLLRAHPTAWTAADCVGVFKLMSLNLASNWDLELARLKILTADGPEALAALDPAYPEWLPLTSPVAARAGPAIAHLAEVLATFTAVAGVGGASNNWVIAGNRTASRRPIVANDPHLAPVLPSHWYLAHVRTPEWAVAGATLVGGPGFPVGHNGHVAWGITAGCADTSDLYLEEVGPNRCSVREGDRIVPCEVRRETMQVKGSAPVVEEVLVTPRGPIIGPALDDAPVALSLQAVFLQPRPIRGFLAIHKAKSFAEARREFAAWPGVSSNLVMADTRGTIGWQLVGETPRRKKGWGTLPQRGSDPDAGWEAELIPLDEMPGLVDPQHGFVATANNKPVADGGGPYLGCDFLDGFRQARIIEVLDARSDWDLAKSAELQMDQHSLPWREIRDVLLGVPTCDPLVQQSCKLLATWDGRVSADSPAAAVFELLMAELAQRVARSKAPNSWKWVLGGGFTALLPKTSFSSRRVGHLVQLLKEQPPEWFERSWPVEIADALRSTVERLQAQYGEDPAGWAWGRVRSLTLKHALGAKKLLGRIFNVGPIPWGGDATTPGQATVIPLNPTGNPTHIGSLRAVMDVGAWGNCRFVLPGGQSGNPFSPHYADQFELWRRGEGVPIAWTEEAVTKATCKTLELTPAV